MACQIWGKRRLGFVGIFIKQNPENNVIFTLHFETRGIYTSVLDYKYILGAIVEFVCSIIHFWGLNRRLYQDFLSSDTIYMFR